MTEKDKSPDKEMSLMDHISDLRKCLIRCSWWVLIFTTIAFIYRDQIYNFFWEPYQSALKLSNTQVIYSNITDPFTIAINQSIICGLLLASPFIIYESFKFIAPALKPSELKAILYYSIAGLILFIGGVMLGYKYMLPHLAEIMETLRLPNTSSYLNAKDFLATSLKLIIGIGLIFQFPLVLFFAVKIGIVKLETITSNRKIILVFIMIVSAFATPPDLLSLFIVAVPFYILFEITIICCRLFIKQEANTNG